MDNVDTLMADFASRGIRLRRRPDGKLGVGPPEKVTNLDRVNVARHREAILRRLPPIPELPADDTGRNPGWSPADARTINQLREELDATVIDVRVPPEGSPKAPAVVIGPDPADAVEPEPPAADEPIEPIDHNTTDRSEPVQPGLFASPSLEVQVLDEAAELADDGGTAGRTQPHERGSEALIAEFSHEPAPSDTTSDETTPAEPEIVANSAPEPEPAADPADDSEQSCDESSPAPALYDAEVTGTNSPEPDEDPLERKEGIVWITIAPVRNGRQTIWVSPSPIAVKRERPVRLTVEELTPPTSRLVREADTLWRKVRLVRDGTGLRLAIVL